MKNFLISAIIFTVVFFGIVLIIGGETESNTSSGNIQNKVTIVNTKFPTSRWPDGRTRDKWFDVTFKNTSNQDLGGKTVKVLVHYQDGSIKSESVELGESFLSGETRTKSVKIRGYNDGKSMYGDALFSGDVPIKVEIAP